MTIHQLIQYSEDSFKDLEGRIAAHLTELLNKHQVQIYQIPSLMVEIRQKIRRKAFPLNTFFFFLAISVLLFCGIYTYWQFSSVPKVWPPLLLCSQLLLPVLLLAAWYFPIIVRNCKANKMLRNVSHSLSNLFNQHIAELIAFIDERIQKQDIDMLSLDEKSQLKSLMIWHKRYKTFPELYEKVKELKAIYRVI